MNFFIPLVMECNLSCLYCKGKSEDHQEDHLIDINDDDFDIVPDAMSYSIADLKAFIEKDPQAELIFYGGEPLLKISLMEKIMDTVKAKFYILQTNGMLLDRIKPDYLRRMDSIIVSIDGGKDVTDLNRGQGVYGSVIRNMHWLKSKGYNGETIARMTITTASDIKRDVLHLASLGLFDAIHWQLDALFWKNRHQDVFGKWSADYNEGIKGLTAHWLETMKEGSVIKLYPFLGIMQSLLYRDRSKLRCGAGWAQYCIQTDGNITPCVCMQGMNKYYAGNIRDSHPLKLKCFDPSGPCTGCSIFSECGGRCLYANLTNLWGDEGYKIVCRTVRNIVDCMKGMRPDVEKLVQSGIIKPEDFSYHRFNSCEIIP